MLAAAACGGSGKESASSPPPPAATTAERVAAPAIAGTTLDGEPVDLADLRGRPVFVNVWSSW